MRSSSSMCTSWAPTPRTSGSRASASAEEASQLVDETIETVLTTAPVAVVEAKSLTDSFDRWMGTDEELREWVLDKTSEMRASAEGQEGLESFLEGRKPAWSSEDQDG